jgi:outer membrane protein assembly factor BamB
MRNTAFEKDLGPARGKPVLSPGFGYLDDTYFKRIPWKHGSGNDYGRLMVCDGSSVYFVRMFDSLRGLDPTVFFTPGQKGYLLVGKDTGGTKQSWMGRIPVRIRAMALTTDRLFVAGPPDVVDPKDPLGAFEGRRGGLLYVFDTGSGQELAHYPLAAEPAFNGIAAAGKRIYLTGTDGSVVCLGGE